MDEKDLYNYIVLKKNSKRQLKSRVFYEDRHVHKVEVHPISDDCSHCYVRASVLPSLPTADQKKSPAYQPWVMMSKVTGCVHSAYCNCPAGEGECCNNIGALLYGIVDLTEKKKSGELASTSKPCVWSNYSMLSAPRKRKMTPQKSEDLTYSKRKVQHESARKLFVTKDHILNETNGCTVNVKRFRDRLNSQNLNVGWLKNFPQDNKAISEPELPSLHDIKFMFKDNVDIRKVCQCF